MLNLILSILCSALIAVAMRFSEKKVQNNMGMFVINYILCGGLSFLFMNRQGLPASTTGLGTDILLGIITGILYLAGFMLLQLNIHKNGMVLASTFMKLGIIISTLIAIFVFHERPKITNIIGIVLAVAAIILMYYEKDTSGASKHRMLLIVILIVSGFSDSMTNIFDKVTLTGAKDLYLLITFGVAMLCAFVVMLIKKQRITAWDALFGVLIGLPNYFSSRFLLGALHQLPATVVFPTFSVMSIVLVALAGVLLFKEKLSRRKLISVAVIFVALVLLNI